MDDLIRGAIAVGRAFEALGNECFEAEGATFIRNRSRPDLRGSNCVTGVTAGTPKEIERLLARVEAEFAAFPHRQFEVDCLTPPALEPRLVVEGYKREGGVVLVLEAELNTEARPHDVRLVESDAEWGAYGRLLRLDWKEVMERLGRRYRDEAVDQAIARTRDRGLPARHWLAYLDGEARAYCSSFVGPGGMGMVEDLFTHPDCRHWGLATALVHRCVADCRERGAGPVIIGADPDDTPKQMYAAMGFRPLMVIRSYWKEVAPSPSPSPWREREA
ncbi:MAG: GNAT family N-acetyltransferase [Chloroflexi bacterium]|nr:GNAT family N-acetyltransferase [Chloroflexota bacterium]